MVRNGCRRARLAYPSIAPPVRYCPGYALPSSARLRLPIGSNARLTVFLRGRVRGIRFELRHPSSTENSRKAEGKLSVLLWDHLSTTRLVLRHRSGFQPGTIAL